MLAAHWHKPQRVKRCTMCGERRPLADFYAYGYTTNQGKQSTRYESRCMPCARARRMAQYEANSARDRATSTAWKRANVERLKAYNKALQACPDVRARKAMAQRRRFARMKGGAGPDCPEIIAIYEEAKRIEALASKCPVFDLPELGRKMHVDHVVALARGGKHEASNLQILPAGLNLRKWAHASR